MATDGDVGTGGGRTAGTRDPGALAEAARILASAYRAAEGGGSVDWSEVDRAHAAALRGLGPSRDGGGGEGGDGGPAPAGAGRASGTRRPAPGVPAWAALRTGRDAVEEDGAAFAACPPDGTRWAGPRAPGDRRTVRRRQAAARALDLEACGAAALGLASGHPGLGVPCCTGCGPCDGPLLRIGDRGHAGGAPTDLCASCLEEGAAALRGAAGAGRGGDGP